jgi:hypothetical protein
MRSFNMQYLTLAAVTHKNDPIAAAVVACSEVGVVVPSLLRKALTDAGYAIVADDAEHAKDGFRELPNNCRCQLKDKTGAAVAHGVAADSASALLHAVLGYVAELDGAQFGQRLSNELHAPTPAASANRNKIRDFAQQLRAASKA